MKSIRKYILPALLFAVFLAAAFLIRWPMTLKTPCTFSAVEEWELIKDNPSRLVSTIRRNDRMTPVSYTILQFSREDFGQVRFDPSLVPGQSVEKGRSIGEVISSVDQLQLADLLGDLNQTRAGLRAARTGEKAAVREEAAQSLAYAKTQHESYMPVFERNRQLRDKSLISEEEWELSRRTEELLRRNILVQQARVAVVASGEKTEAVRAVEEEVARVDAQVRQLQAKIALGRIEAPFAGQFSGAMGDSLLCRVDRLDSVVCTLLLRSDQVGLARPGQEVVFRNLETGSVCRGPVIAIDVKGTVAAKRTVYLATAAAPNPERRIRPGMTGFASVRTGSATLARRLQLAWGRRAGQSF
jgi:hypothetical protein